MMEKTINLSASEVNTTDKIFYNIFACSLLFNGIENLKTYNYTVTLSDLLKGIIYSLIAIFGVLKFNKIWLFNKPNHIRFTGELIAFKTNSFKDSKIIYWNHIKSVTIKDLNFIFDTNSGEYSFNLDWTPLSLANHVKAELLNRLKENEILIKS